MIGALAALRAAVPLLVGILLGVVGANTYASFTTIPAAREQGAQTERLVWQEAQRAAEAKAELDRRAAQARIDAIERSYHERETERLAQLSALEAAIEKEASRVPIPSPADRGAPVCRPAVPRSLRDALAPIGAAPSRFDPAGAASALR